MDSNRASSMEGKHTRDKEANLRTGLECKLTWVSVKPACWASNLLWYRLLSKTWLLPTWWSWTCRWTTFFSTIRPNLISTLCPRTSVSNTILLSLFSRPRRRWWVSNSYSIHFPTNKGIFDEMSWPWAHFFLFVPQSPNKLTWLNCGQNLFYDKLRPSVIWLF